MVKVTYMEIPEELKELYSETLQPGDRFVFPRIITKKTLLSRKRKLDLKGRSVFTLMAVYWKTFSDEKKDEWRQAGLEMGLTNWQLFIQDQAARMAAEISGFATPKILYQSWVGQAKLDDPSDELFLIQIHPRNYWIRQKVPGTKSQYSPVELTEDFDLPLNIGINFKTELEAENLEYEACFYADIWYSYQGVDHTERLKIDFPVFIDSATYGEGHYGYFSFGQTEKESVWTSLSKQIGSLTSYVVSYNLFFYFKGLKGSIYFDNMKAEHSGQNWVRDFDCRNLTEIFPRAFYQVPAHWFVIEKSGGAHFDSVYFNS